MAREGRGDALTGTRGSRGPCAGRGLDGPTLDHTAIEIIDIRQILDAGERATNGLRRYLRVINGVATVTPLLGLLGTVLGMMPHPERAFLKWQWGWMPEEMRDAMPGQASPWLRMFQNARTWCEQTGS